MGLPHLHTTVKDQQPDTTRTSDRVSQTGSRTADSELLISGRVVSWLDRTPDGAIVMGRPYPPGRYTLVNCPDDSDPNELVGDEIVGNDVGWIHLPEDGSVSYEPPSTEGTYLLVTQVQH